MQGRRGQGDIIPGFDCTTGKAVGYVRDEWDARTKELILERHDSYLIAKDTNGIPIYEIFREND